MMKLGDDELTLILSHLQDPHDRTSFSEVCKRFLTIHALTRTSIRLIEPDSLHSLLPRFPNLTHFHCSAALSDNNLLFISKTCPNLKTLNLSFRPSSLHRRTFRHFSHRAISSLASRCRLLSAVSLRRRTGVADAGVAAICAASNHHLRHLDLGRCSLVGDGALEAIGRLNSLQVLNLEGCSLVTDLGLGFLACGPLTKTLKVLVLVECDRITDTGVSNLKIFSSLEELNLAECGPKVTDVGCVAVFEAVTGLKKVNLSWLVNVTDAAVVAMAEHGQKLVAVNLTGCELVSGVGIKAFEGHGCLESLVIPGCHYTSASDLECAVLGCKSLKYVELDKGLMFWLPLETQEKISRFCDLGWS
ncbi:hypothetical protein HN51_032464 [Arachis hypogaea]|uniref:Uncharacterized protein n=2 Tax=Arachis TaxID=3817 RepID=A0A445B4N4_ARAHY|nr:F-box/LRR-repeat protein 4-like [Arachis duranensis]XP_025625532.1 F-box/LRR-repeat protein 4 [Arachis hypogaea]QHO16783.1 F-box/LRR-repeat protein [Arachis hypogaea]RYR33628.1 hypothetical protein Ahy_A10g048253 [Arachis hypogaea]